MKKAFCFALLTASLIACEKDSDNDEDYCWSCTTTLTQTAQGFSETSKSSVTQCGLTVAEKDKYVKDGTSNTTTTTSGITVKTKITTTCTKQ